MQQQLPNHTSHFDTTHACAGALEVKHAGRLVDHVEQAKKEAFAMWCHNALLNSYEPVWVVLTDLEKVR